MQGVSKRNTVTPLCYANDIVLHQWIAWHRDNYIYDDIKIFLNLTDSLIVDVTGFILKRITSKRPIVENVFDLTDSIA